MDYYRRAVNSIDRKVGNRWMKDKYHDQQL